MRLQLLSDLHLETERFDPEPAPDAELLVLAGDIDSRWIALERFADWPVPVVFVVGNHEFDGRELDTALPALRERCERFGLTMLERQSLVVTDDRGRRIRLLGSTRWSDFDLLGEARRPKAMRAAGYFMGLMKATQAGRPFDAEAVRAEALACRDWLQAELMRPSTDCERTVVITHFAPSARSADPRYGVTSSTASFCNADDDLIARCDLWLHGHLHCRHDYRVARAGGTTRVVCNPRGHADRGEPEGHQPLLTLEI